MLRHAACAPRQERGPGGGGWRSLVDELVEADAVAAAEVAELGSSDED